MNIVDTLSESELFGDLDRSHLEKLAPLCRGYSYSHGTTIFNEGEEATELYILTDGRVSLDMDLHPVADRPSIPTALEVITKGEGLGWSALVEPYVYMLSARCMSNCTTLAIKGELLRNILADDTSMGYEVMKKLAQVIALRLTHTRLRLVSGLGIALLAKEVKTD